MLIYIVLISINPFHLIFLHCCLTFCCSYSQCLSLSTNGTTHFKTVNHCLNNNIHSYFETSGGQSSNLYLNVVPFLTTVLIRHLWQLKTVVSLHWCLICGVQFKTCRLISEQGQILLPKIGGLSFYCRPLYLDCDFLERQK